MNNLIKQDINFLEYPLHFVEVKSLKKGFIWQDMDGYIYKSIYKAPNSFDALILMYLLLESQKQADPGVFSAVWASVTNVWSP